VVWEGRSREAPPYPDHWPDSDPLVLRRRGSGRWGKAAALDVGNTAPGCGEARIARQRPKLRQGEAEPRGNSFAGGDGDGPRDGS
jgi:hypothetical protein